MDKLNSPFYSATIKKVNFVFKMNILEIYKLPEVLEKWTSARSRCELHSSDELNFSTYSKWTLVSCFLKVNILVVLQSELYSFTDELQECSNWTSGRYKVNSCTWSMWTFEM